MSDDRTPTLLHRVEYAALRCVVALLGLVPWRVAQGMGAAIGKLGYWPLKIRRRVVEKQIRESYPELNAAQHRRIAIGAYANLGRLSLESAIAGTHSADRVASLFHEPVGWELLERAIAEGRGTILIGGHFGNWELGHSYIASRGIPVTAIARQMSNPLFDAYLTRNRRRLNWGIIPDRDGVKLLPRVLREGHAVPMLADQGVQGLSAEFVPFFGRLARTPRGPALMALRHKPTVLFYVAPLEPDGKFRLYLEPVPLADTGDRAKDIVEIVATYTRILESWVRRYPDQYLWQHRRWRRRPDGTMDDA